MVETISLFKEPEYHKRNYAAFQHLTGRVGSGAPIPERRRAEKIEKMERGSFGKTSLPS
ncbi:hypothetical protein P4909_17765 [Escherichia coli]